MNNMHIRLGLTFDKIPLTVYNQHYLIMYLYKGDYVIVFFFSLLTV